VEDNAVPVERLAEFVREFRAIVAKHGTRAAYWAHASVGVLHVRPMIDIHDPADRERLRAIAVEVADLARRCGGIMSGEHVANRT
jgi:FAD/FMN-containing dehydrogenase